MMYHLIMETVKLYHGTNSKFFERIQVEGFKPSNLHAISKWVEDAFGLERDSIWNHAGYGFNRNRADSQDEHVYFATDRRTAESYAEELSEPVNDALETVYMLSPHWDPDAVGTNRNQDRWVRAARCRLGMEPKVLEVELPFNIVQQAFPKPVSRSLYDRLVAGGSISLCIPGPSLRGLSL